MPGLSGELEIGIEVRRAGYLKYPNVPLISKYGYPMDIQVWISHVYPSVDISWISKYGYPMDIQVWISHVYPSVDIPWISKYGYPIDIQYGYLMDILWLSSMDIHAG